jgi:hypothetical protein
MATIRKDHASNKVLLDDLKVESNRPSITAPATPRTWQAFETISPQPDTSMLPPLATTMTVPSKRPAIPS